MDKLHCLRYINVLYDVAKVAFHISCYVVRVVVALPSRDTRRTYTFLYTYMYKTNSREPPHLGFGYDAVVTRLLIDVGIQLDD